MGKGKGRYGGDPSSYQLRDMNRRITSIEKAIDRHELALRDLRNLMKQLRHFTYDPATRAFKVIEK